MPETSTKLKEQQGQPIESRTRRMKGDGLLHADAEPFLHGALRTEELDGGWFRPWRFAYQQIRALTSTMAWRPGLYRYMASTTAGISVEFLTDARFVGLEVVLDDESEGTQNVLRELRLSERGRTHDGFSADCNGIHLAARFPHEGEERVLFDLAEDGPLSSEVHHVRLWLPWGRGCLLRDIVCDGSYLWPVDARPYLLVLGDSIAQGFVVDDPAHTWPALLANDLGIDHLNQGLGGQIFQSSSLADLKEIRPPEAVLVALGTNYAYAPFNVRTVTRDAEEYFARLERTFPDIPVYVATPGWFGPLARLHPKTSIRELPEIISACVAERKDWTLVDGNNLLRHGVRYLADGAEHPNADGAKQMAESWAGVLAHLRAEHADATETGEAGEAEAAASAKAAEPTGAKAIEAPVADTQTGDAVPLAPQLAAVEPPASQSAAVQPVQPAQPGKSSADHASGSSTHENDPSSSDHASPSGDSASSDGPIDEGDTSGAEQVTPSTTELAEDAPKPAPKRATRKRPKTSTAKLKMVPKESKAPAARKRIPVSEDQTTLFEILPPIDGE